MFYECGICESIHPWEWDDDCREDSNRLTLEDIPQDALLMSWEDRINADTNPSPPAPCGTSLYGAPANLRLEE